MNFYTRKVEMLLLSVNYIFRPPVRMFTFSDQLWIIVRQKRSHNYLSGQHVCPTQKYTLTKKRFINDCDYLDGFHVAIIYD